MASTGIVMEEDGFIDLLNPGQTLHVNADVPPLVTIGDMPPVGATGAVPPVVTTTSAVPPVVTTSAVPPVVTSSGGLNAPPITTTAGASTHVNPGQYPWLLPGWTGQASFPSGQASFIST